MTIKMKPVAPLEASIAARARLDAVAGAFPLSKWLPTRNVDTLNFSFDASGKRHVDTAEFRAFDTEAPFGRDFGGITKEGKLPPISRKRLIGELSELRLQGGADPALKAKIIEYTEGLADATAVRLEYAKAEAILTGKLILQENGLSASIDYGRDPSLTVTLSATKKWSAATSTPIDDISGWRKLVGDLTSLPTSAITDSSVMEALSKNQDVIKFATQRTEDLPSRVTYDAVRGVFAAFGISNVTVWDEAYSGFALDEPLFPAGTFILLPAPGGILSGGSLGETQIGIPAEALNDAYQIPQARRAGIFAGAFDREDPEGVYVLTSAIALPVVERANATLAAQVL